MNNDRLKFRRIVKCRKCGEAYFEFLTVALIVGTDNTAKRCDCNAFNDLPTDSKWEQCTGIKDIENNLAFEGDICEHPTNKERFTIFWSPAYCALRAVYQNGDTSNLAMQFTEKGQATVIGNIHENPELLK